MNWRSINSTFIQNPIRRLQTSNTDGDKLERSCSWSPINTEWDENDQKAPVKTFQHTNGKLMNSSSNPEKKEN